MKLKAFDILNKYDNLTALANKEVDLLTACTIAKNINALALSRDVINKKRDNIVLKYAEKDENGNVIQKENGNLNITDIEKFNTEITEILETEIEVEIGKISIEKLQELKVSPAEISSLLDIME